MKRKTKVYISKSGAGTMDDLMNLRSLLSKWDCEVTEFLGSRNSYTPVLLDKADILFVLPPHVGDRQRTKNVGKGQHDETNRFMKSASNFNHAFIISYINNEEVTFESIRKSVEFIHQSSNWQDKYGYIAVVKQCVWELDDIMELHEIKYKGSSVSKSSLLIASKL